MDTFESFEKAIYTVNEGTFPEIAVNLFHFQALNNPVYRQYLEGLDVDSGTVKRVEDIPFLPVAFFKTRTVKTGNWQEQITFTSSGSTGNDVSRHYIRSTNFYLDNATKCFNQFFGPPGDFVFLALLPSYTERAGSSLVLMVDHFIRAGGHPQSGYYRNEHVLLANKLMELSKQSAKVILWGVTFALLDLAEQSPIDLNKCIVIETGGMKGRREEITRDELHGILQQRLNVPHIVSEYGMTELLSQAYSMRDGLFHAPPWMKVAIRDPEDPLERLPLGRAGGINVIDLANIHSCAFVETEDLGRAGENGSFEVLGRLDNSDIRGCSLLG